MEQLQKLKEAAVLYVEAMVKWSLMALVLGGAGGALGTLFHHSISHANALRAAHPWLLYCLPLAGLVIVFLYHRCNIRTDRGTNLVLDSARENEDIPLRIAFLMFVSTTLTQLCGGSAGREGAALQLGGSVGSFFNQTVGRRVGLGIRSQRAAVMCGMSAVFSALFGTPLTAAIFSLEVVDVGAVHHLALLPCLLSSLVAFVISQHWGGEETLLPLQGEFTVTNELMLKAILLGFCCALVSILFCTLVHQAFHVYGKLTQNAYLRVLLGGVLVVGLSTLLGTTAYNGAGMELVLAAAAGQAHWYDFLLKLLFTAITLGAGFKGGEIVPSFAVGATFGCVMGSLLGIDPGLGAALGLVAVFCGVVNCPFTSMLLGLELCGGQCMVLFALVSAVSLLFSGSCSLYSSQRITKEKFDCTWYNDRKAEG